MNAWQIALTIVLVIINLYGHGAIILCAWVQSRIERDPEARRIANEAVELLNCYPLWLATFVVYALYGLAWPAVLVRKALSRRSTP